MGVFDMRLSVEVVGDDERGVSQWEISIPHQGWGWGLRRRGSRGVVWFERRCHCQGFLF